LSIIRRISNEVISLLILGKNRLMCRQSEN
jgi:hypothetical protein